MSSLAWPTIDDIKAAWIAIHKAARPSADDAWGSDLWLDARKMGRAIFRLHQTCARVLNALFPATTFGTYLDSWLRLIGAPDGSGGYGLIVPHISSGTSALAVVSTGAGPWVDLYGYQLTDTAGNVYQINEHYTPVAATTHNADVASITKGKLCNLETGATLTFTSPPAGITAAAVLVADLDGGLDQETDAAGRARLASWLRDPPASGNVSDWVDAINAAAPGALQPYVWMGRNNYPTGYGLVDYCALQLDEYGAAQKIAAASDLYAAIAESVEARLPVLLMKQSRQLTINDVTTNALSITITLSDWAGESDACDWDAETPGYTVDAVTKATLKVNVDAGTVATYLTAGDRVIIDGAQAVVVLVGVADGLAADEFTVDAWFDTYDAIKNPYPWTSATHGNGRRVYSGGGTILSIVGKLREYVATIGPCKCAATNGPIPGWDDTLRLNAAASCAIVAGEGKVIDVVVNEPGADWTPASTTGTSVNRVVPGDLIVWEAKP